MKRYLIFTFLLICSTRVHAQFPSDCLPALRTFAGTFATANLRTSSNLWSGGCVDNSNISRSDGVMIGAHCLQDSKLAVTGGIISTSLRVLDGIAPNVWPDYVYTKNYKLMPLSEVKTFIATNKHLPNTPSEAEVKKEGGFGVGSVLVNHQEKIEEIFLHLISLKEQADKLNQEFAVLSKEETSLQLLFLEKLLERKQTHREK